MALIFDRLGGRGGWIVWLGGWRVCPRIVLIETRTLENHADVGIDLSDFLAALRALSERGITKRLNGLELVSARGAGIFVSRHGIIVKK